MLFEKKFKNIEKEEGENKNHFNPTIQNTVTNLL